MGGLIAIPYVILGFLLVARRRRSRSGSNANCRVKKGFEVYARDRGWLVIEHGWLQFESPSFSMRLRSSDFQPDRLWKLLDEKGLELNLPEKGYKVRFTADRYFETLKKLKKWDSDATVNTEVSLFPPITKPLPRPIALPREIKLSLLNWLIMTLGGFALGWFAFEFDPSKQADNTLLYGICMSCIGAMLFLLVPAAAWYEAQRAKSRSKTKPSGPE
jgi:hypothetical protein